MARLVPNTERVERESEEDRNGGNPKNAVYGGVAQMACKTFDFLLVFCGRQIVSFHRGPPHLEDCRYARPAARLN